MTQSLEQIRKADLVPGIYPRFDWYTAMWHDCSIDQIYAFYEITQEYDGTVLLDDLRSQFLVEFPPSILRLKLAYVCSLQNSSLTPSTANDLIS